jgi:hypothetical protein
MGTFEFVGLVAVVSILVAVAFDMAERWLVNRRSSIGDDANAREDVAVGDVWEHVGDYRPGLTYVVAAPNSNTEAGPDSWVMRRVQLILGFGGFEVVECAEYLNHRYGGVKYMHRKHRLQGDWIRRVASCDVVRGVDEHEITHSSAS